MPKKITQEKFINESNIIHNYKYDYSNIKYNGIHHKICIICNELDALNKKHGEFWQTPNNHKNQKNGCPKCDGKYKSTELIIAQSNKIHKEEKYDYSKVEYNGTHQKICIICHKTNENGQEHGEFWQTPHNHLTNKQKCPKCVRNFLKTSEFFIKDANKIHNGIYNYSKVKYNGNHQKICIICNNHNQPYEFWQTPSSHLNGHGCPKCKRSKGESSIEKWLNDNNIKYISQHKFKDCRYKYPLPFDFYLPDFNMCIEYDGEQHYIKTCKYYSESIIRNDKIKNEYCKQNNIYLLRIKYNRFHLIEYILDNSTSRFR